MFVVELYHVMHAHNKQRGHQVGVVSNKIEKSKIAKVILNGKKGEMSRCRTKLKAV